MTPLGDALRSICDSLERESAVFALAAGPAHPQDEVDLTALVTVASADDRVQARRLATLVIERGFHGDRDLVAELDRRFS